LDFLPEKRGEASFSRRPIGLFLAPPIQSAGGALGAGEPLAGAARLAATDSGFVAQVIADSGTISITAPIQGASGAWARVDPSGRRAKLARKIPALPAQRETWSFGFRFAA
jgi:hypothetical protein